MKKTYEKPIAEIVEFEIDEKIMDSMGDIDTSFGDEGDADW